MSQLLVLLTFVFSGERTEAQRAGTRRSAYCLLLRSCWGFYTAEKLWLPGGKRYKTLARKDIKQSLGMEIAQGSSYDLSRVSSSAVGLERLAQLPGEGEQHAVYPG